MKKELLEILKSLDYDQDLINKVKEIDFSHETIENPYHDLEKLKSSSDFERFILSLQALIFVKKEYDEIGITPYIFKESMEDFNIRAVNYYKNHNKWGIKETDLKWLSLLFNLELFKLHSLRFQIFPMNYIEMERKGEDYLHLSDNIKERLPEGFPLINIHIETDTKLNEEAVDKSLILAYSFFHEFFPEYEPKGFISRTWLLHPSLRKLLPIDSNIIKFASRFEILGLSNNYNQALSRIYGSTDPEKIRRVPKKTSLQKEAFAIFQELGVGIGYLEMDINLDDKSSLPKILRQ